MLRRHGFDACNRCDAHIPAASVPSESYAGHIICVSHIIEHMINSDSNGTRTLTLVLPEADWKALRAAEPDAIGWLRTQIQNRLAGSSTSFSAGSNPPPVSSADTWWGNEDEY
jgi:hypothetical protein